MGWVYESTRNQNRYAWSWNSANAQNNAWQMYYELYATSKMTLEALCGIIGNICCEGLLNPWQEQVYQEGHIPEDENDRGYGLIQWTPQSSLTSLYGIYATGEEQTQLIYDEIMGVVSGRFYPSVSHPEYSYSGQEFCQLTDVEEAAKAYFYERERGTWTDLRKTRGLYYYEVVFQGEPPIPPVPPQYRKMPLWMYLRRL